MMGCKLGDLLVVQNGSFGIEDQEVRRHARRCGSPSDRDGPLPLRQLSEVVPQREVFKRTPYVGLRNPFYLNWDTEQPHLAGSHRSSTRHRPKTLLGDVNNETIGHANLKNRSERTESLKRK